MNLWDARQQAEAEYKQAVCEYDVKPTQRNADRLKIKQALLDGLKRLILEARAA